jgi:hypothetical protein
VKSSKSKGKNNARTRRGLKKHPVAGPGLSGALGPCVKVGKKNRGQRRFVRNTHMLARGQGRVKINAAGLRGG